MSGIYFHIPFCKAKCNYCDFYKSTNLLNVQSLVSAIKKELDLRKGYLNDRTIETIYFGGGTPSVLQKNEIADLLSVIHSYFEVLPDAEITFEANPDDLSPDYLEQLATLRINRLSIGIQSFSDKDLRLMGRRHDAEQAKRAVLEAQKAGFKNISVDLIYGIPGMDFSEWKDNLLQVFDLNVQHLSAYHLTYHEGTPFWKKRNKGIIKEVCENESLHQFEELILQTSQHNYIHYEISNFALEGYFSKHNSSYWNQVEYLGLGPSAHSFNTATRYWNVSDVKKYIDFIDAGVNAGNDEVLTLNDKYNDYLITRLRTIWGIDKSLIKREFGEEIFINLQEKIQKFITAGNIEETDKVYHLTKKGIFISDAIIEELFLL